MYRIFAPILNFLLGRIYHDLYHSLAWTYDVVAWLVSAGRWQQWIRASLPLITGDRILELGFGTGHLQKCLLQLGYRVTGVDESRQMCLIAQRKLKKLCETMGVNDYAQFGTLIRGHAQRLPFRSETFSSILSTFPSEYILNPETLLDVSRVLRPSGRFVVVLSAKPTGSNVPDKMIAWLFAHLQSDSWLDDFEQRLRIAGMSPVINWIQLRSSRVLVCTAYKESYPV
jgi:ubiquinone/menaquinone biosynthesis C-methylase UbiE